MLEAVGFCKPLIGTAFALFGYAVLTSHIIPLSPDLATTPNAIAVLGFVAAFSERFIPDMIFRTEGQLGGGTRPATADVATVRRSRSGPCQRPGGTLPSRRSGATGAGGAGCPSKTRPLWGSRFVARSWQLPGTTENGSSRRFGRRLRPDTTEHQPSPAMIKKSAHRH